jgi:hypothetical protein
VNNNSVVGAKNVASASTLRFFALLLSLLPSHAGSTGLTTPRRSILLEKMGQDGHQTQVMVLTGSLITAIQAEVH